MDTSPTQIITGSRTLRIAIVAPSLDILGGQGVAAAALRDVLLGEGFDVRLVPINPRFPYGLRWLRRVPVLRTLLNQLLYLPSLAALRRSDVVHIFSASYWSFLLSPVPAILAARLFGRKVVLNYHSGEAPDHLDNWGARVHPWLRLAHEIVVPSAWLKTVFARHCHQARVIRNTVDTSNFRFRERLPLSPRLLSARNLEPHYRVDNTLKAFALIRRSCPQATLTVAGYGSQEATLKQWVATQGLPGVRFVGRVEPQDMPHLYDAHDLFLNSSEVDNQPISILEAFATGLNVISTPTGDIPSMVQDGITGHIVPHDDPETLASVVLSLLERPREAAVIAERARREVESYTWPQVFQEWATLYKRLAQ